MSTDSQSASLEYSFLSPAKIVFGWGSRSQLAELASGLGRRALLLCGSRTLRDLGAIEEIRGRLESAGIAHADLATIDHEPEVADVDRTVADIRALGPTQGDFLLPIGGGSVIDLGKACAAMVPNDHAATVQDFLEGVGTGAKLRNQPLPLLAMPTTAGTGTEATKNAVISCYAPAFKKSLRSERMLPRAVLIDPELTVTLPATTTAYTGMDAITQLIESYVSRRARPIPQALCVQGLEMAVPAIVRAVRDGTDRMAREQMAHAALLSGMALANSGLGLAHGVAAALGVHCRVAHGLACAVMLPAAMQVNRVVARAQFARLAPVITGRNWPNAEAAVEACIECIRAMCSEVGIPQSLSEMGVSRQQLPALVASSRGNSMSGNPRDLSDAELLDLLESLM